MNIIKLVLLFLCKITRFHNKIKISFYCIIDDDISPIQFSSIERVHLKKLPYSSWVKNPFVHFLLWILLNTVNVVLVIFYPDDVKFICDYFNIILFCYLFYIVFFVPTHYTITIEYQPSNSLKTITVKGYFFPYIFYGLLKFSIWCNNRS